MNILCVQITRPFSGPINHVPYVFSKMCKEDIKKKKKISHWVYKLEREENQDIGYQIRVWSTKTEFLGKKVPVRWRTEVAVWRRDGTGGFRESRWKSPHPKELKTCGEFGLKLHETKNENNVCRKTLFLWKVLLTTNLSHILPLPLMVTNCYVNIFYGVFICLVYSAYIIIMASIWSEK